MNEPKLAAQSGDMTILLAGLAAGDVNKYEDTRRRI